MPRRKAYSFAADLAPTRWTPACVPPTSHVPTHLTLGSPLYACALMDISSSLSFQNFFPNSRSFFPTVGCAPAAPQLRSLPSSATAPPASVHRTDYCVRSPWCSPDGQDFVCVWEISSQKKGPVENLTALHGRGLEYSYRYSVVERRCRTKRETSCFGFLTARWAGNTE